MVCFYCKDAGKALSGADPAYSAFLHSMCIQNRIDASDRLTISHVEPTQCTCQHQTDHSYISQERQNAERSSV